MKYIRFLSTSVAMGLMVGGLWSSTALAETAVIVNPSSNVANLSPNEIRAFYLGKNKKLRPVDQAVGSRNRREFISKVVGKSESQFKAYWSQRIFSGKGTPPQSRGNSAGVKKEVASSPNTIGFIDSSLVDGSVKVVYTVK